MIEHYIIDDFLPEDYIQQLYNDLNSFNMVWVSAEEQYEADTLLGKNKFEHNSRFSHITEKYGFTETDINYDIQNVAVLCGIDDIYMNANIQCWQLIERYILDNLGVQIQLRTKINQSFCTPTHMVKGWHVDREYSDDIPHKTALLYINDNNGGTLLETGDFIKSKRNRLVVMDGKTYHTPVSQTDCKKRYVLNYNFI
jgi:hypothetical protein